MSIANGYLSLPALKAALGNEGIGASHDAQFERAIEAASRQIDAWYGGQFWKEANPVPRVFRAEHRHTLWTGDFATTAGLVVEVDDNDDGAFETAWVGTDWQAEPLVRINGRPYDRIVALGSRCFPGTPAPPSLRTSRRARVRVTAAWGWPAVPKEVEQACQVLAVDHYKSSDLVGGIAGFGEFGPMRVSAFNPLATALLEQLRTPVFG